MKYTTRLLTSILLLALALLPAQSAYAKGAGDGQVVFGSTYTVKSGETFKGDLVVFGGVATVEADARITGNLVVIGGSLTVDGSVDGDAVIVGGAASLGEKATVGGDMVTIGGTLQRAEGAHILGQIVTTTGPVVGGGPSFVAPTVPSVSVPNRSPLDFLFSALRLVGVSVLGGVFALLIGLFMPDQLRRTGQATVSQPLTAGGLGCLTFILGPTAITLLALTVLLIPVAVGGAIVFGVAIIYGWLVLGFEVGDRLLALFHAQWPVALVAGLGTFLITLVLGGLNYIPCLGIMIILTVLAITLGGVLMTRFGTRAALPPVLPPPPVAPSAPAPPVQ